jgi:Tfp pilus assembly protein PilW
MAQKALSQQLMGRLSQADESKTKPPGDRWSMRASSGITLVEYMVGIGIAALVLTVVVPLSVYSGRSFAGLANYADLNSSGLLALDQMSKDVRQAVRLSSYATNQLVFDNGTNGPPITFEYDAAAGTLTRLTDTDSKVLLTGCDSLNFGIYQRTPVAGTYDQYPVANVTNCKVVAINWVCSRKILGSKMNSENAQSARLVIRKH